MHCRRSSGWARVIYVVICRQETTGRIVLATRKLFKGRRSAERFAKEFPKWRAPEVMHVVDYLVEYEGWKFA